MLLFLVASGVLLFSASNQGLAVASPSPGRDGEPPPPRALPDERASDYVGTWSYRWGDSPRDENGAFTWLRAPDPGFTSLGKQEMPSPPGRNGQRFLWLRTTLDGPALHDPTLYLEIVDQLFEAYLDGQRIYSYGELNGARRFLGYPIHLVPLGDGYRGQTLTLRIYSEHINIGLFGRLRIGSKARLITEALRQDIGRMFVGFVVCAIGLFVFVLFFNERKERAHLYYAVFTLTVGLWMLGQMRVRCLLLDRPLLWTHVEIFSLYTNVAALSLFLSRTLGRGPFGLMPILARVYIAFDLGAALLSAPRPAHYQAGAVRQGSSMARRWPTIPIDMAIFASCCRCCASSPMRWPPYIQRAWSTAEAQTDSPPTSIRPRLPPLNIEINLELWTEHVVRNLKNRRSSL